MVQAGGVRIREFWLLVEEVLGRANGRAAATELVLTAIGGHTAAEALDLGVEPRVVWHALADEMDVPEQRRWGSGNQRLAPPRR